MIGTASCLYFELHVLSLLTMYTTLSCTCCTMVYRKPYEKQKNNNYILVIMEELKPHPPKY